MRTKPTCWSALFVALVIPVITGCDMTTVKPASVVTITQMDLDHANFAPAPAAEAITGDPYHGFRNDSGTVIGKLRALFTNTRDYEPVEPGAIWICRLYRYADGSRGALLDIEVMLKREPGYFTEGGDYEYMAIPYDSTVDYAAHPNGILPSADDRLHRGKGVGVARCVACHHYGGAGGDRLYSR